MRRFWCDFRPLRKRAGCLVTRWLALERRLLCPPLMDSSKAAVAGRLGQPFLHAKADRSNGKRSRAKRVAAQGVQNDRLIKKQRGDTAPKRYGGRGEPLVLLHPF